MRLDYRWTASARMTTQMSDNGDGSLSPVVWSCGKLLEGGPLRVYIPPTYNTSADGGAMDQAG